MIRPVFLSVIGLVLGAAGIAAYSGASAGRFVKVSAIQQTEKADLVVLDARVLTVDDKRPEAEAFAVRDGKFIAVGTAAEVRAYIGPQTTVWNLRGKTITPGFNDAHIHPSPVYNEDSPHFVPFLGPPQVRTMDDLIAALKRKAARTPKGEWVMGTRFQDTKLGRWPTRYDLDKVSTEHPILISHSSGHVSVANSLALEKGRITRDTPNPPGGEIGHDEKGEPNGFLGESARRLLGSTSSERKPTTAEIEGGYVECFRRYLAKGITSIGIAGTSFDTVATMRTLHEKGKLPLRLNIMLREGDVSALAKRKAEAPLDDPWIRLGSIKLFHGNSLSGRTCWLYEPYADRPTYYGVPPARTQAELNDLILKIHEAGFQACIHSNGDREIDMVLNAFENAQKKSPRDNHRHRIEHCSVVNDAILKRIKELGVVIVPHSYEWEHGDKFEGYGAKRWDWMHPNGSAVRMGIPVAAHSDAPVSSADPMLRIQSMVTRKSEQGKVYGAKQTITVEQAIRIWTQGGAYTTWEDAAKGTITVGKWADFVVLTKDPRRVPADALKEVTVEKTVVGGKAVFELSSATAYLQMPLPLTDECSHPPMPATKSLPHRTAKMTAKATVKIVKPRP